MELQTERLSLHPMSDAELQTLMEAVRPRDAELADAYNDMLRGSREHPQARLWPQPEIGYGMIEAFWGRGYATESAGAMCRWALAQPGVTAVEAETAPDNAASIRVLAKLGFQPTGTLGEEGPRFLLKKSPDTP